jgi:ADP-ribose pyrophosphatase YjhB (NUDIX family)
MPNVECLVTHNDHLLMIEAGPGMDRLLPIQGPVRRGESPLAACAREVFDRTGYHVSPSCAGVIYAAEDSEHDYTLVFIADAPAGSENLAGTPLRWVDLRAFRQQEQVSQLHRDLVPLLLTADGPLIVFLDSSDTEGQRLRDAAPIPHARLSPLVFAIAQ